MRFELEGYRCFSSTSSFDVGEGVTAFVGPNNAGKSTVLRSFYELRPLLRYCRGESFLNALTKAFNLTVGPQDSEIIPWGGWLSDRSSDDELKLRLGLDKPANTEPEQIEISITRKGICRTRVLVEEEWWPGPGRGVTVSSNNDAVNVKDRARTLVRYFKAMESLVDTMYVAAFRNVLSGGSQTSYFDIVVGETFVKRWAEFKGGPDRARRQLTYSITEDIRRVFGYRGLQINTSTDRTTLELLINDRSYLLDEVGAGIAQFIVVLVNAAMRQPTLILIDEPEMGLHPSLQRAFITTLAGYAREGLVFSSHSIGLAHTAADKCFVVYADEDGSRIKEATAQVRLPELLGEVGFASYRDLGMHDLLLVEGPTDVRTFQEFLRLFGRDRGVVILDLGGGSNVNGNREPELSELLRVTPKVHAVIDSERTVREANLSKERMAFLELCKRLGIRAIATERRATENYLTTEAIQQVKGLKYSSLGDHGNFSEQLGWSKRDNWKIARMMKAGDLAATDIGHFLAEVGVPMVV